jgi:gamma-glutamylcyclotransferase (GGCT)/AIG2-like uncharacterized protein YtfP
MNATIETTMFISLKLIVIICIVCLLCVGLAIWIVLPNYNHEPRTEVVFVYGTLKNTLVRALACRCLVDSTPTILVGYTKIGRNIIPSELGQVSGKRIQVSAIELARLDRYEKLPTKYQRTRVLVSGETVWVYSKVSP